MTLKKFLQGASIKLELVMSSPIGQISPCYFISKWSTSNCFFSKQEGITALVTNVNGGHDNYSQNHSHGHLAISLTQIQPQGPCQLHAQPLEKAPDKHKAQFGEVPAAEVVNQELCKSECFLSSQTYNMQSGMGGMHPSCNLLQVGSFYWPL